MSSFLSIKQGVLSSGNFLLLLRLRHVRDVLKELLGDRIELGLIKRQYLLNLVKLVINVVELVLCNL